VCLNLFPKKSAANPSLSLTLPLLNLSSKRKALIRSKLSATNLQQETVGKPTEREKTASQIRCFIQSWNKLEEFFFLKLCLFKYKTCLKCCEDT
jgi:hypothetical protein